MSYKWYKLRDFGFCYILLQHPQFAVDSPGTSGWITAHKARPMRHPKAPKMASEIRRTLRGKLGGEKKAAVEVVSKLFHQNREIKNCC